MELNAYLFIQKPAYQALFFCCSLLVPLLVL
jgi:hypothetical protein